MWHNVKDNNNVECHKYSDSFYRTVGLGSQVKQLSLIVYKLTLSCYLQVTILQHTSCIEGKSSGLVFFLQTQTAEKLFSEGGQERRDKMAEERKRELKTLRQKLMAGTKDNLMDQFDDLLNASANKVKKTKVSNRFG